MDISIFLAKFWGWYIIIFFVILSINPRRIKQIFQDLKDEKFLILSAFLAIIIGLLNLLFHNIWEPSWKIVITLIGWFSLSIGLFLFIFPKRTSSWLILVNVKLVQTLYTLLLIIGMYLLNVAYGFILY
ncbi:hypothetical protein N7U66_03820 [Lacinutrix neustonica]|uniref:Uncharacterized protein n=1 Tax=Lacinutrix neustonica TaxID=2980107 RepID=A0A9E8SHK7_9FLAO|nr:hypothetical protein [Lacinutrix neustonica]WAC02795.1 hypothetical protein N7U66_03820 [Lacinutrix neustonica]